MSSRVGRPRDRTVVPQGSWIVSGVVCRPCTMCHPCVVYRPCTMYHPCTVCHPCVMGRPCVVCHPCVVHKLFTDSSPTLLPFPSRTRRENGVRRGCVELWEVHTDLFSGGPLGVPRLSSSVLNSEEGLLASELRPPCSLWGSLHTLGGLLYPEPWLQPHDAFFPESLSVPPAPTPGRGKGLELRLRSRRFRGPLSLPGPRRCPLRTRVTLVDVTGSGGGPLRGGPVCPWDCPTLSGVTEVSVSSWTLNPSRVGTSRVLRT